MTHPPSDRHAFLPAVAAVAILALIAVRQDARAAKITTTAQLQMNHGGQGAGNATFKVGDLTVTSPWTRATPGGAKIAGGYLKIINNGALADRFIGAKSGA